MTETDDYHAIYARRLRAQGPDHYRTAMTLYRLLAADLRDTVSEAVPERETHSAPSDLPDEVEPQDVRLDGDHTELLADALTMAVELQERHTAAHGPEHPKALVATLLLAHALAAADQLDGQIESSLVIIEDAREGLLDAAATGDVGQAELDLAEAIHHWILELVQQEPRY